MKNEPIRTVLIPVALAAFVAAGQAFLAGADTRAIVTAGLGALIVAGQEWARSQVTPVAPARRSSWSKHVKDRKASRKHEAGQAGPISVLLWLLVAVVIVLLIVWLVGAVDAHAALHLARSSWSKTA